MKIQEITSINVLRVDRGSIKFTDKTHKWCTLPYPNHKKGCPNFNKNPLCPPNAKIMENILENYRFFYLILAYFDIFKYTNHMMHKHPNWSERKARCVLYWQKSVKKLMREYIKNIYLKNPSCNFYLFSSGAGEKIPLNKQDEIYSMEAAGINVIQTLINNNIKVEVKLKKKVILVNLLCSNKKVEI